MRYLADRTARQPLYNLDSHFQANHEYHEEDLLVDIWAYDDQRHLQDENQLLMPPVKSRVLFARDTSGHLARLCLAFRKLPDSGQSARKVRKVVALELAASMFYLMALFYRLPCLA